jgi:uroporphyrin-III C-methyltransferase
VNDPSSSVSDDAAASANPRAAGGSAAPASTPADPASSSAPPSGAPLGVATRIGARTMLSGNAWLIGAALVGVASVISLTLALLGQQRIRTLEQELVRRQQDSQAQAIEARALAKQAQDIAHASEAKLALLEARVAENALQRTQLEELIQQLSRSRDENVLADVESSIRVAVQQSAITGSAEPLTTALRQAEDRLARMSQPRLERVRRAMARDIDRVRAVAVVDVATLTIKLDEAVRMVDDLPLLAQPERKPAWSAPRAASAPARAASAAAGDWSQWLRQASTLAFDRVWGEVRSLLRVTRIDNPEAMLVAPEQAWFLRENLKLRLLNARLALLSRQFDTAQSDLRDAHSALERYFDRGSRRVALASELVRQVATQARQVALPRPDETLAAIAAAQAGR